eukprot:221475-Chlamydomonas_euryale.AAC.1
MGAAQCGRGATTLQRTNIQLLSHRTFEQSKERKGWLPGRQHSLPLRSRWRSSGDDDSGTAGRQPLPRSLA